VSHVLAWRGVDLLPPAQYRASLADFLIAHKITNFQVHEIAKLGRMTTLDLSPASNADLAAKREVRKARAEDILGRPLERVVYQVALQQVPRSYWPNILFTLRLMQNLRRESGSVIDVSSGWRDPLYNVAVGGALHGQHPLFTAVDLVVRSWTPDRVRAWIEARPEAQSIGLGYYKSFTHLDGRGVYARWGPVQ